MPNRLFQISGPPKNHLEAVMLMASRLCGSTPNPAEDFRSHYQECDWCHSYVEQEMANTGFTISEVGWWNGYGDCSHL